MMKLQYKFNKINWDILEVAALSKEEKECVKLRLGLFSNQM